MLQSCGGRDNLQIVKGKLARRTSKLVDEAAREVAAKDGAQVRVGDTLDDGVEPNLLNQEVGERVVEDRLADALVLPELRTLQLLVQRRDGHRQLVREDGARDARLLVLAPDGLELEA